MHTKQPYTGKARCRLVAIELHFGGRLAFYPKCMQGLDLRHGRDCGDRSKRHPPSPPGATNGSCQFPS